MEKVKEMLVKDGSVASLEVNAKIKNTYNRINLSLFDSLHIWRLAYPLKPFDLTEYYSLWDNGINENYGK